jgi:hypothetical protein
MADGDEALAADAVDVATRRRRADDLEATQDHDAALG